MKTSSLPTTPISNQNNAILLTSLLYMGLILLALSSANALAYYFESDQATGVADVQNEFSNSAEKVKQVVSTDLITKITLTNDADTSSIKDHQFPDSVQQNLINFISDKIDHDQPITIFNDTRTWTALTGETAGTHLLRFSILPQRYTTGSLTVEGAQNVSLYLNEQTQSGKSSFDVTLLNQDYRALMIVSGVENWQNVSISWTPKNASKHNDTNTVSSLAFDNDQNKQRPTMRQFFDSQTVGTLNLSPDGRWLLWSKQHYSDLGGDTAHRLVEILDMSTQQVAYRFQAMRPGNADWRADSQAMVFTHNNTLFELTTGNWQLKTLATDVKGVGSVHYVKNDQLLFTWNKPEKAPSTITKRYRALQDRWSYWRGE